MDRLTVGIDLGGTKILALIVAESGEILARAKSKTKTGLGVEGIGGQMHKTAEKALKRAGVSWEAVERVGIAVPTSVDPATGDVLHAPALGWRNQPARAVFESIFEHRVVLENDVNCGTLAECRAGAAKGAATVVGYFVGTGLGGGVVIDGEIRRGRRGVAGELGHEIIRHNGKLCGCGHRGCVEAYASKTAFCREFRRLILKKGRKSVLSDLTSDTTFKSIKSSVLAEAYRREDPVVCKVLRKGAWMLGVATANLHAILAPDCVVYGGGVMEALGPELLPEIRRGLEAHLFGITPEDVSLRLSALGDDAVPLGAACLAADTANE
ncbi:MAG: ROK family protein [Kiritimatiellaeota bacterium]|nr:ROK family protein [Kiritimatiellota bacterium]